MTEVPDRADPHYSVTFDIGIEHYAVPFRHLRAAEHYAWVALAVTWPQATHIVVAKLG